MRFSPPFPPVAASSSPRPASRRWPRLLRRGPMENTATAFILVGVGLLMQPFSLALFGYSFVTILIGAGMFMVVSHFPK